MKKKVLKFDSDLYFFSLLFKIHFFFPHARSHVLVFCNVSDLLCRHDCIGYQVSLLPINPSTDWPCLSDSTLLLSAITCGNNIDTTHRIHTLSTRTHVDSENSPQYPTLDWTTNDDDLLADVYRLLSTARCKWHQGHASYRSRGRF